MSRTLQVARKGLGHIPFIFILLLIAGYFWLFGDSLFPGWDGSFSEAVSYYIALLVIFLIFSRIRIQRDLNVPANIAIQQFGLGFIATLIFMMGMFAFGIINPSPIAVGMLIPMVIMHVAIVAPAEELMFRGVLLSYVGIVAQALIFAFWHTVTYGYIWSHYGWPAMNIMYSLFIAFAFGIVMGFVARRVGLPACIGAHACYNLVILGVILI